MPIRPTASDRDDPHQQYDLSTQEPEVLGRLKAKLLEINASIMEDAHDWHLE